MDITFNSLQELYDRLRPALATKKNEMHRLGLTYIKEEDVWNYFKEVKWMRAKDLNLYEMVNDVLNTDSALIDDYLKSKLSLINRKIYFEEDRHEEE